MKPIISWILFIVIILFISGLFTLFYKIVFDEVNSFCKNKGLQNNFGEYRCYKIDKDTVTYYKIEMVEGEYKFVK